MNIKHSHQFKFTLKELGDQGKFVGSAAVYGNVDLGGDVIEPGAFTKTIEEKNGEVPILWQHDSREPIGLGKLTDSKDGLMIEGSLVLESPVAQKAYALLKNNVLKGLSIGYDTVRDEVKGSVRFLKELKLWEVSLVTFPMNTLATVTGVKTATPEELMTILRLQMEANEDQHKDIQALIESCAAKLAPGSQSAAEKDSIAPESLHPMLDRINSLLKG